MQQIQEETRVRQEAEQREAQKKSEEPEPVDDSQDMMFKQFMKEQEQSKAAASLQQPERSSLEDPKPEQNLEKVSDEVQSPEISESNSI